MARVVVGVDGSENARAALAFAADEARLRGATLHVLHVWRMPLGLVLPEAGIAGYAPVSVEDLDRSAARLKMEAEQLLAHEVEAVLDPDPQLDVRSDVVEANPAAALLEASHGAELLVLGSRGRGGFKGLLLGSVSQHAARHALCPVVIVPPPPATPDGARTDSHALSIPRR